MTRSESADDPSPVATDDPHGSVPLRQLRRTRVQRLVIVGAVLTTVLCFIGAGALVLGQQTVERRQTAGFENRTDGQEPESRDNSNDGEDKAEAEEAVTESTFPEADPDAKNFLITGADNGECIDPDSEFAGAFGDRSDMGERSDTIMIWRIDPGSSRAAILSLPRDLWVTRASTGGEGRINSEYSRNDPQNLVYTINDNFGIYIDHFIQVDFCAFKELVDAVGGVTVPFEFRTRDTHSGLNVEEPGCYTFTGDHALAYVRSRYYEILPPGEDANDDDAWERDATSDRGRITRQQDFMRRLLNGVLDRGLLNPSVVRGLNRALTDYIVTDPDLTLQRIMEFAGVAENLDPNAIPTYQFVADDAEIGGQSVLLPAPDAEGMPEVLALFRGERSLERLPTSVPESPGTSDTPTPTNAAPTASPPATGTEPGAPGTTPPASTTTPSGPVDDRPGDIQYGMHPDPNVTCD